MLSEEVSQSVSGDSEDVKFRAHAALHAQSRVIGQESLVVHFP